MVIGLDFTTIKAGLFINSDEKSSPGSHELKKFDTG